MDILLTIIAQLLGPPDQMGVPGQDINAATFTNILNVVYFIAGAIAVIAIVIGGILLVTSSGDPNKSAIGRNAVLYSAIGLVVVAMAFAITNFVLVRAGV